MRVWQDKRNQRYVVYRRAGGVERKTSVRYKAYNYGNSYWSVTSAARKAGEIARRLSEWPAHKLANFKF